MLPLLLLLRSKAWRQLRRLCRRWHHLLRLHHGHGGWLRHSLRLGLLHQRLHGGRLRHSLRLGHRCRWVLMRRRLLQLLWLWCRLLLLRCWLLRRLHARNLLLRRLHARRLLLHRLHARRLLLRRLDARWQGLQVRRFLSNFIDIL